MNVDRIQALTLAVSTVVALSWALPILAEEERETLPEGAQLASLEVYPESIEITEKYGYRQALITGVLKNGDRVDVTRMVTADGPGGIVTINAAGLVRAASDGSGEIKFSLQGQSVTLPVKVGGQSGEFQVSFIQDVMPAMSRIGCNAGTCHGAAKGKNGFKLSLRGYDPIFDHRSLTDDLSGRRFNRAAPDRSLFLLKTSGVVPHVGGVLTKRGEPYYETFRRWVADGVQIDLESSRVASIDVLPKDTVIPLPGMRQQVVVLATYTDGSQRDVTAEAFVEGSDIEILDIEQPGLVTGLRRGEAAILARYEGRYAATRFYIMGDRSGFAWKDVDEYNYIDMLVYEKLRKVKSLPSELCTDAEFLRRVYIDMTGLPPRTKDVRAFLMDRRDSRSKRAEVVDRLIGSAEFVDHWTNKWADLLQVNPKFLGKEGASILRSWIQESVASNMPYNEFVHSILVASGSTLENPPAAYYKILREPENIMENTTQLFLAVRFNCNKCHDHPFERWTQNNYWQMASFFAQVGRKDALGSSKMPRTAATQSRNRPAFEEIIFDAEEGEVTPPYGGTVNAVFPYEHAGGVPDEGSRRQRFASWLTSANNPYFAKSFVNRLWSYFLGVGFIEPIDDIRAGNPPSNPELLDRLTKEFIDSGFDARRIMGLILKSRVYQHSIATNQFNEDDAINFSHALARRLPAEVLYDAIHQATGSIRRLPGQRIGTRAAELSDPSVKPKDGFLDLFGRPPRESACECERISGMSLGQSLNLVNGPTVAGAIRDPQNLLADLVAVEKDSKTVVEELFLSFLSRMPAEEESAQLVKTLDANDILNAGTLGPEDQKVLADAQAEFEKKQVIPEWTVFQPELLKTANGTKLAVEDDGVIFASGDVPETDTYTLVGTTDAQGITGIRIEVLTDERLPENGPGRNDNGRFSISELRVAAVPVKDATAATGVALQNASASASARGRGPERAIDNELSGGWTTNPGSSQRAVFEFKEDVGGEGETLLTIILDQQDSKSTLGKFRLWVTTTKRPVRTMSVSEELATVIRTPIDKRTDEQKLAIYREFIAKNPAFADRIRLSAAQDIAWALVNTPAFLFNR